jgi:hypothetical protein
MNRRVTVSAGLALAAVLFSGGCASRAGARQSQSVEWEVVRRAALSDGWVVVARAPSGHTLSALSKGREIVDWRISDGNGQQLPVEVHAARGKGGGGGGVPSRGSDGGAQKCVVSICTRTGGAPFCFDAEVPCGNIKVAVTIDPPRQ